PGRDFAFEPVALGSRDFPAHSAPRFAEFGFELSARSASPANTVWPDEARLCHRIRDAGSGSFPWFPQVDCPHSALPGGETGPSRPFLPQNRPLRGHDPASIIGSAT